MGFVMQLSAIVCALLIGWSGEVGAVWTMVNSGNAEGAPCVFPFTYNGVDYNECITTNWDDPWCATTGSYDADKTWGVCTTTPPAGVQENPPFEVYTKAGKKCVFPFKAYGKTFNNCTTEYVTVKIPWCSTTADFDKDREMGYCNFSRSSACGGFKKLENKFAYDGIEQMGVATLAACQKLCLDNDTCLGLDFNKRNRCYLHFDEKAFNEVYAAEKKDVDHYIRQVCTTTAAPTTAVMSTTTSGENGTCEDSFEMMNNTMAFGGEGVKTARSVDACKAECLQYTNDTGKYCLALDYNDKAGVWCYLHFISKDVEILYPASGILHFKRVKCILPANATTAPDCGDGFNKTENRLSYGGEGRPLLKSVADCQKGCLANKTCMAFDYDKGADTKCFHHLSMEYANEDNVNPNAPNVDQYVRVKVPCPEATTAAVTTESTLPPTTKPQKTTRPVATTKRPACVDSYKEKEKQLSFGGKQMKNISTVDGCKAACNKMADCVGFDYNRKVKECFTHNEATFKFIADNDDVTQYTREKCSTTTTVVTTVKPTPASTSATPACVKEFVKSADKHAFDGDEKPEAKTFVDCKQLCLATPGCAGFDFNREDSCWLHDSTNIEPIANFTGVDNYKLEENCKATTASATTTFPVKTTLKPVCKDSFSETKDSHALGGTECPSAKTLEDCQEFCVGNTSCVAIDFVAKTSECWVHMPKNEGEVKAYPFNGITHYRLTRCAHEPTMIVTTTTVPTTTVCEETFTETPNKHAFNGVEIGIANTLEKCKETCRGNDKCMALDFKATTKGCWIHVDAKQVEKLGDLPGVNHFRLDRRCGSTATTTMPAACVADIAMVVDSSGSIRDSNVAGRKDNYELIKEFLSMLVGRMRIGSQETRVAAVTFSNFAQMRIPLNQYSSLEPLQAALLDLPYSGGRTNTTGALRLARTEVFKQANGDRPKVKNIIVLITDGNTTVEASKLTDEVRNVKEAGITVFGIGVTEGINKNELKSMVSEPVSTHFFTVDDFNQLIGVLENVILGTCAKTTTPSARR